MNIIFIIFQLYGIIGITLADPNDWEPLTLPPAVVNRLEKDDALRNPNLTSVERNCVEYGGINAHIVAQNGTFYFTKCLSEALNSSLFQHEIEKGKSNGNLNEVFKQYCQAERKLKVTTCFNDSLTTLTPCFPKEERGRLDHLLQMVRNLMGAVCKMDGQNISLFYAEDGPQCWNNHEPKLEKCIMDHLGINVTVTESIDNMGISLQLDTDNLLSNLSKITFDDTSCNKMLDLKKCVLSELNQCPKGSVPKIFEMIFKEVLADTSCQVYPNFITKLNEPNSASDLKVIMLTIIMSAIALLL